MLLGPSCRAPRALHPPALALLAALQPTATRSRYSAAMLDDPGVTGSSQQQQQQPAGTGPAAAAGVGQQPPAPGGGSSSSGRGRPLTPPEPPGPEDCCQQGCKVCVWDIYEDKLAQYNRALAEQVRRRLRRRRWERGGAATVAASKRSAG